jgi:hypothetical protein
MFPKIAWAIWTEWLEQELILEQQYTMPMRGARCEVREEESEERGASSSRRPWRTLDFPPCPRAIDHSICYLFIPLIVGI